MALALAGGVDPVIAVKFAVALQGFWMLRGYATEGRRLVKAALALPAVESSDLAKAHALYVGAALAESQSDHAEARQMLETCLALRRELGNPESIAATLRLLSSARLQAGDAAGARGRRSEAMEIFRRLGRPRGRGHRAAAPGPDRASTRADLERRAGSADRVWQWHVTSRASGAEGECELLLGEVGLEAGDLPEAARAFRRGR